MAFFIYLAIPMRQKSGWSITKVKPIHFTITLLLGTACTSTGTSTYTPPPNIPPNVQLTTLAESNEPLSNLLPEIDPWALDGDINIAGSSTVFPFAERMAERFQDEGFNGNISIDSIGSGGGFERFCQTGETDITTASRRIKDSETESCRNIGRIPIEFKVGTDALAIVVSNENDFLFDISIYELGLTFSDRADSWSDVRPEWPNEPISRFIPGTDSGTFDFFVEAVFGYDEEPHLKAANLQFSEDDNVLIQGILGSPYSVGYFGYAYYSENAEKLNILSVGTIEANNDNVDQNIYPLSRPLYLYSDANIMRQKLQVAAFIAFVINFGNEEVEDVGYFATSDSELSSTAALWINAMQQEN